jgi:CubicO group peptidase (beta-lactamase class C family)
MSSDFTQQLAEVVEEQRQRWGIPGIAVGILRDGEIQKEGYGVASLETGFPVLPDMLFQIGSNSKVYTTTLLMTLVDEGKVNLDTPVLEYLPDLKIQDERALEQIVIRHLVSHQSGIWGDVFDDYGWGEDALRISVEKLPNFPQMYQPTELWSYTNVAFNIAGRVIEEALGQPFEVAMRERVFEPLGLERTFYFPDEVYPYPHAVGHRPESPGSDEVIVAREYWLNRTVNPAGGIHSTVEDVLKFDQYHLTGQTGTDAAPVLSDASRMAMREEQIKAANFATAWGLGWWLIDVDGTRTIGHGGGTNGFITRNTLIPDQQTAWAIFTNSTYGEAAIQGIQRWLYKHVAGLNDRLPEVIAASSDLSAFAGEYRNPLSRSTIEVVDGGVRVSSWRLQGDEEVAFPPVIYKQIGEREFMATQGRETGVRIDFILNDDGSTRFVRMGGRLSARQ